MGLGPCHGFVGLSPPFLLAITWPENRVPSNLKPGNRLQLVLPVSHQDREWVVGVKNPAELKHQPERALPLASRLGFHQEQLRNLVTNRKPLPAHTNLSEGRCLSEVQAPLLWYQLLSPWRQGRQGLLTVALSGSMLCP